MWLQVEMTQPAMLSEIQFESSAVPVVTEPIVPGAPPRTMIPAAAAAAAALAVARAPPEAPAAPDINAVGFPRAFQIQTSMDGTTWSAPVAQGQGCWHQHARDVRARAGQVRPHHADGDDAERAADWPFSG